MAIGRWEDVADELRKSLDDTDAQFSRVYLLDDFTASGTTFCQKKGADWKGKLPRFYESFCEAVSCGAVDAAAPIFVHHYIGTKQAETDLQALILDATHERGPSGNWFKGLVRLTFGNVLDANIRISSPRDDSFIDLCNKYYDRSIEKPQHGQVDLQLGYKGARLPLVLQHNTPNNTPPIVWKESDGLDGHRMRALFRRRERH